MENQFVDHFHSREKESIMRELNSNINGLSKEEAKKRLKKGYNVIPEKKATHPIVVFLKQFNNALIYILVLAAIISFIFHHMIDVYVIVFVIFINATIGYIQQYKAERAIRALKKMIVYYAKVYRQGELLQIPARNLVEGDIVFLEEGDRIPADARLLQVKNFRTVESSLTGESFPVDKVVKELPENTVLADCKNMVWMSTFVASGQGKAVVIATGIKTAIGKVAQDIQKIKRTKGHFEKKTGILAKQLALIAFIMALIIFSVGFFVRGFEFAEIFLFTIAALVSGIPEGLPAVLAVVLAIGAFRMSKRNAIIRTLPATEALGVISTIITDKTGTLTENTMNVEKIFIPGKDVITVKGEGWKPKGNFYLKKKVIMPLENLHLEKLLRIAAVSNNARLIMEKEGWKIIGDPTEAALVVLAQKAGINKQELEKRDRRLDDLPFNPQLKYRASLSVLVHGKEKEIYVIGAPESILKKSSHFLINNTKKKLMQKDEEEILKKIENFTSKGMRVIALAYKNVNKKDEELKEEEVKELIFTGIVGIRDPPRPEVKEAIKKAKKAGIRVIMATGDHRNTALAIAREIDLVGKNEIAITEQELEELKKEEFEKEILKYNVFARLTPRMKLRIASVLQKQGHVVAMTGDGVNDAPALKKADVGISMGIIGTDVARESSEIVLADDNFASIVNAIEEGRIVFKNVKHSAAFLITTNFAEGATILTTMFLGLPLPLLPTQILFLNLVTDTGSGMALAAEPGHGYVLKEAPRDPKENILSKNIIPFMVLMFCLMAIITVFVFFRFLPDENKARTGAFAVMAFTQLFNLFNMRRLKKSVFSIGFFSSKYIFISLAVSVVLILAVLYIPFLQNAFHFGFLKWFELLAIIVLSSSVFLAGELYKFIRGKIKNDD